MQGNAKKIIRVAEFEKLFYDDKKLFKKKHWQALCEYREKNHVPYFTVLHNGIRFSQYVGVIQAGDLTIEVLPKTDRQRSTAFNTDISGLEESDGEERQSWHNVLLQMLRECKFLHSDRTDLANLNLKSNSILEIYLELFLFHVEKLLREGLVKQYRKDEANRLSLKGQLLFSKNISQNLIHQERFYTRDSRYCFINIYNQLLYKTLRLILSLSRLPSVKDKTRRLLLDFPEMPDCKVTDQVFDSLYLDRKTAHYRSALMISRMLLLNYRPDITGGTHHVIAILFDMNRLWEEFIYRRLKKEDRIDIRVHRQQRKSFWRPSPEAKSKTIQPDIILKAGDSTYIIDTKWKIIDNSLPADNDLRQMFAYNLYWESKRGSLLYPSSANSTGEGQFHHFENQTGYHSHCIVQTISVIDNGKTLNPFIAREILKVILG